MVSSEQSYGFDSLGLRSDILPASPLFISLNPSKISLSLNVDSGLPKSFSNF